MPVGTKLSPKIVVALSKLDRLWVTAEAVQWQIGDQLIELVDRHGFSLKEIAKRYGGQRGRSYSRLSEYYTVAKAVPQKDRLAEIPHFQYQVAVAGVKRVERDFSKELGRPHHINVTQAVKRIIVNGKGRGASRQFTKAVADIERKKVAPERKANADRAVKSADGICELHLGDYVATLEKIKPNSIQLLHLDPPYAHYLKSDNGKLDCSSTGSSLTKCANENQEAAITTTCAAFRLAVTRLRKNGAIVLWQAGRHLREPIIRAIEDAGFVILPPFIWNKCVAQPGDMTSAVSLSVEFAWVIVRQGEAAFNLDGSDRQQVHNWPLVKRKASELEQWHLMEKPVEINRFLIKKFTTAGDLIFDAFGCSGGMCVEAARLKRRWVYCEMEKENFDLGQERMEIFERSNSRQAAAA